MRHRKSGRQLNRNASHRKAMFKNMANSLILHETIKTTLPKAKELRRVIEPLITRAKADSVANRRHIFSKLRDDAMVAKLFTQVGPFYKDRPGGYVRILKAGFRTGDKAPMVQSIRGRPVIGLIREGLGTKGRCLYVVGPLNRTPVQHAGANTRSKQHAHPAERRKFRLF